jgi:predicted ATPase/DNA-binding SARP family transcriptional activator/tetratricopeptide (TPR) repeat protein
MQIAVLGPLEVRGDDGRLAEIAGTRLRALLIRLALDAGRLATVEALVDALWGDAPPAGAVNALQSLVSRLRRALPADGDPAPIESRPAGYRLTIDPDDVDANRFERLAADGARALAAGDPAAAYVELGAALALWRGPALADITAAAFAGPAARRLDEVRLAAIEDRAQAGLALGRAAQVVAELEPVAAAHPLRERLAGLLVRGLSAAGRQADALAAYQRTRGVLSDELGIDPSPDLQAAHLAVLRGEPAVPGAEPQPSAELRTNLRAQLTSFVGRDEEVERVGKLLDEARLVTLVGPGGAGKTRLATEAASQLIDRMPDGVWLVELAPVQDPAEVPYAVSDAVGIRESSMVTGPISRIPDRTLESALRHRAALLILDNCEHLVGAVAALADRLLAACPQIRVLATSREPLAITGETLCPVTPLVLPPPEVAPAQALGYPAVRLFADRAAAVRPGFEVGADDVGAVVEICRRLDGLPLAIELAAARLRLLSVQQIVTRLSDRFRLLTGGSRTALPRHQTLRAVVDWSWDLLEGAEQALAARLSAFPGGATLDAVEQVCASAQLSADEVLTRLAALVDKSLIEVVAAQSADGATRYRMLETVRMYAAERLAETGAAQGARAAHARYFVDLVEWAEPRLRTADQLTAIARLTAEHDNLIAALRWAVDAREAATAVQLSAGLGWFWTLQGRHSEAAGWLREALAVDGEVPVKTRVQALMFYGMNEIATGDPAAGRAACAEAENLIGQIDPADLHPAFVLLGPMVKLFSEGPEPTLAEFDQGMAAPDAWTRAIAQMFRGFVAANEGAVAQAEADLLAAANAFRELGDRWGMAMTLSALGEARSLRGDHAGSVAAYAEGERLMRQLGAWDDVVQHLVRLAMERLRAGEVDLARTTLSEAAQLSERHRLAEVRRFVEFGYALLDHRAGDLDSARRRYEYVLGGSPGANAPPQVRALMLSSAARLLVTDGEFERARALHDEAVAMMLKARDMPLLSVAIIGFAQLALAEGDPEHAAVLLGLADTIRGMPDAGDPDVAEAAAATRAALGEDRFAAAYQRGAEISRDDVLAVVRREPADRQRTQA